MHKVNHTRAMTVIIIFAVMLIGGSLAYSYFGPQRLNRAQAAGGPLSLVTTTISDADTLERGVYALSDDTATQVHPITLTIGRRNSFVFQTENKTTRGKYEFEASTDTFQFRDENHTALFRLKSANERYEIFWEKGGNPDGAIFYFYKTS